MQDCLAAADEAVASGLLAQVGAGELRFAHALIRDAVRDRCPDGGDRQAAPCRGRGTGGALGGRARRAPRRAGLAPDGARALRRGRAGPPVGPVRGGGVGAPPRVRGRRASVPGGAAGSRRRGPTTLRHAEPTSRWAAQATWPGISAPLPGRRSHRRRAGPVRRVVRLACRGRVGARTRPRPRRRTPWSPRCARRRWLRRPRTRHCGRACWRSAASSRSTGAPASSPTPRASQPSSWPARPATTVRWWRPCAPATTPSPGRGGGGSG